MKNRKKIALLIQQPIILIAGGIIIGIATHVCFPVFCITPLYTLLIIAFLGSIIFYLSLKKLSFLPLFILFMLSILFGFFRISHQISVYEYYARKLHIPYTKIIASVHGVIKQDHPYLPYRLRLQLNHGITQNSDVINLHPCSIDIYTQKVSCKPGDAIAIDYPTINPCTQIGYKQYLIKEKINGTLFLPNFRPIIVQRPYWSTHQSIDSIQKKLMHSLESTTSLSTATLFSALFMGNRWQYKKTYGYISTLCKRWGILHYLARSGLHLVACIMLWSFIMRLIPVSIFFRELLLLFVVLFYCICSWQSVSFSRALALYLYSKLSLFYQRPIHFLYALSIVTIFFLIHNPILLYFIDFQLSFLLTGALGLYRLLNR